MEQFLKQQKLFKIFSEIHLIFFKEDSIEKVNNTKDNLRQLFGIGKSSIHITDNNFETEILSKLVLSKNGLHFLNNSNPFKFEKFHSNLYKIKEYLISKIEELEPRNIDNKYLNFKIFENNNEINIFFDKKNLNLIGWQTKDIYQNLSITFISSVKKNQEINSKIFKLPENN